MSSESAVVVGQGDAKGKVIALASTGWDSCTSTPRTSVTCVIVSPADSERPVEASQLRWRSVKASRRSESGETHVTLVTLLWGCMG